MKKLFVLFSLVLIAGCGSKQIIYEPSSVDINEAKLILEDLTWSQHQLFKPDNFEITDTYIAWDFGILSNADGTASSIGIGASKNFGSVNVGVAGSKSRSNTVTSTRAITDRSYYRSIEKVQILSWRRKLKQWYVVRLVNNNRSFKDALRTRSLADAKLYTDSITTLLNFHNVKK